MHHSDLKLGKLLFILLHPKVILFYDVPFLGEGGTMWVNFGPLVQKIGVLAKMKSNGHNFTRNGFYDP